MKEFSPYVATLRRLDERVRCELGSRVDAQLNAALDGGAQGALRSLVDSDKLREHGAFFTGSRLSRRAIGLMAATLSRRSVVLDPACGAGDLLLAAARALPTTKDAETVLDSWSRQIYGRDLRPSFVEAARLRLTLLARRQDARCRQADATYEFPHLKVQCGLSDEEALARATHIVLNPPFTKVIAPDHIEWASGAVNNAAIFLDSCIEHASTGARIVAILPDVLRSGWRYRSWRQAVLSRCDLQHVGLGDQFDAHADVNVFVLSLTVRSMPRHRSPNGSGWKSPRRPEKTLRDAFDISVGPVVDYRDPHRGRWHPFVHAKTLTPWDTISEVDERRRFAGRLVAPPFVAVKRTSRPDDAKRAIGSVVNTDVPVAVENHVMVLRPRDGTLKSCKRLLMLLARKDTTDRLNRAIRCRHLTIGALADLPWSDA
jgi:hypothetical protein